MCMCVARSAWLARVLKNSRTREEILYTVIHTHSYSISTVTDIEPFFLKIKEADVFNLIKKSWRRFLLSEAKKKLVNDPTSGGFVFLPFHSIRPYRIRLLKLNWSSPRVETLGFALHVSQDDSSNQQYPSAAAAARLYYVVHVAWLKKDFT